MNRTRTRQAPILAPSLLSADFSKLGAEVAEVEAAGVDWLHVDVMDGHFVPNMTIGPVVVQSLRKRTQSILDCHLMVNDPEKFIESFAKAGADFLTVHVEASQNIGALIQKIRSLQVKVGLSLRPATSLSLIEPFLKDLDLVLVMSVNPGFGGQAFMPDQLEKVRQLANKKKQSGFSYLIEIDGGINESTAKDARLAGAEVFVAGNAVFGKSDRAQAVSAMNRAIS